VLTHISSLPGYGVLFQCITQCLEFQFDAVISDRAMILHCMHLLSNTLPHREILTWEFFLARFDSLSLEAQIDLESTGDLSCPTGKLLINHNTQLITSHIYE